MYLPKKDVYESLLTLGYSVEQAQPETFTNIPAIIFRCENNIVELALDGNICSQDIEITIDIWGDGSAEASQVLSEVEEVMRSNYYTMTYSSDVPNSGNLHHILSRFAKVKN